MSAKCFRNPTERSGNPVDWDAFAWTRLLKNALSVQRRIDQARKVRHKRKAKCLTRLLNRSLCAKACAIMQNTVLVEVGEDKQFARAATQP